MIWAITSYFNPKRFASRYRNFSAFRARLGLPLLTVEWATAGDFELRAGDSDLLLQVSGGSLMWQKERLLNLALAALPPSCEIVTWLDCDILFEDEDWADEVREVLVEAPIAQLFSEVIHTSRGAPEETLVRSSLVADWRASEPAGLAARIRSGAFQRGAAAPGEPIDEFQERLRLASRPSSGHAWAARRALLDRHGLYDACICGAGDMAIALAALGRPRLFGDSFPLNPRQRAHYDAWATGFATATGGKVGVLGGRIQHLFHGALSNRQYRSRLQWAADSGFDPAIDLVIDRHGPWRWAVEGAAREAWMSRYFERRAEDEGIEAESPRRRSAIR